MTLIKCTAMVAVLGLLAPDLAHANEAIAAQAMTGVDSRKIELRVDGGLFSALGFGGVSVTYAPAPLVLLEGGVGAGLSGPQLSLMPKLAIGSATDRFIMGAGISVGTGSNYTRGSVIWLNVDALGYERRFEGGLSFLLAAGFTYALDGKGCFWLCDHEEYYSESLAGKWAPQGRIGVGYWF